MALENCPHCGLAITAGGQFCESCGKALPQPGDGGPRVVSESAVAATSAGMALQADELRKQVRRASGALLVVAVIQTLFGFLEDAMLSQNPHIAVTRIHVVVGIVFGIAVIFWGLFIWSRKSPLPAAIVGLVLYISLWMLDLIFYIKNSGAGQPTAGPFSGIIVKIIVIAVLIRAVQAGVKYRQLTRQQGGL